MANPEHLEILKQGVDVWNTWRRAYSETRPELQLAELQKADLQGADLRGADLRGADLQRADLWGAGLQRADLRGTNLWRACLLRADLRGANLREANLRGANLRGANLGGANLWGAGLQRADLRGANLGEANLKGANLGGAVVLSITAVASGADQNNSGAPLATDLSRVKLLTQEQLDTMRGDSLTIIPDHLIRSEHWPEFDEGKKETDQEEKGAIGESPIPTTSVPFVFISYAAHDREQISILRDALHAEGISTWWDQNILAGQDWREEISSHISQAAVVLCCWSKNSIASKAVAEEAATGQNTNKLVQVRLGEIKLPFGFSGTQYLDLFYDTEVHTSSQWPRLLSALKFHLFPPSTEEAARIFSHESDVEGEIREGGRLAFVDKPKHLPPIDPDPEDLVERVQVQIENIDYYLEDLEDSDVNWNTVPLSKGLSRYKASLQREHLSWYSLNDRVERIQSATEDEDLREVLDPHLCHGAKQIIDRHYDMAPRLRKPVQSSDPLDKTPPTPPASVSPEDDDSLGTAAANVAAAVRKGVEDGILHNDIGNIFNQQAEDFKEIEEMPETTDKEKEKKASALRKAVTRTALYLGSLLTAISSGAIVNALSNPSAAARLYEILKPLFEFFLRFF